MADSRTAAPAGLTRTLPAERSGYDAPLPVAAQREAIAGAAAAGVWRTDPAAEEETIAGVRVLRFEPAGPSKGTVLHLHGGAFRIGAPEVVGPYAAALAARCGVNVVCAAYRLAPEHPFPAGLGDGWAVLQALQSGGAAPLIVAGDSAGGGLAAVLTSLAVEAGQAPAGLMLLSAWLDLTVCSPDYEANAATDPLFSRQSAETARTLYLQGASPDDPLASPLLGDLAGFPPSLLSVGAGEVLAEDGRRFNAKLQAAGVQSTLSVVAGMEHVAVTRSFELTGARETFEAVVRFVNAVVAGET